MTPRKVAQFQKTIYDFYDHNKRSFPWRTTKNPYHILVSEIMLQQTQADRVIPKFESFIKTFPTVKSLAKAPLKEVLQHWQGLGYNRRALMLHRAAQSVVSEYKGIFPTDQKTLLSLAGIGPYTSGAIMAFAYNKPIVIIETNIRTVFIHHFFKDHGDIHDKELLPLIEQTIDSKNSRKWYSALMDYGAYIKKTHPNPNRKSAHHTTQSPFKGSDRQMRGEIIRILSHKEIPKNILFKNIHSSYDTSLERFEKILTKLTHDGLIVESSGILSVS